MEETTLQEILESTVAVARGLEALQSEHEALIKDYYASENIDSSEGRTVVSPYVHVGHCPVPDLLVVSGRPCTVLRAHAFICKSECKIFLSKHFFLLTFTPQYQHSWQPQGE